MQYEVIDPSPEEVAQALEALLPQLCDALAGKHPLVLGAALGKLLAMWLCGHPDFLREALVANHLNYVRALLPAIEAEIYEGKGHPQNRGRPQ